MCVPASEQLFEFLQKGKRKHEYSLWLWGHCIANLFGTWGKCTKINSCRWNYGSHSSPADFGFASINILQQSNFSGMLLSSPSRFTAVSSPVWRLNSLPGTSVAWTYKKTLYEKKFIEMQRQTTQKWIQKAFINVMVLILYHLLWKAIWNH